MEKATKILGILLIIVVVGVISYIMIFGLAFEGKKSDFYIPVVSEDNVSAYKSSCPDLNTSKVLNDPESLVGQKVKVKGSLLKKVENFDNTTDLLLNVPELSMVYQNGILIHYSDKIAYTEGDILEVYGEYGFLTVMGDSSSDVAVPTIKGGYIEKI
nr:hypothetical protein [uncultured Methanobacterium sp.]